MKRLLALAASALLAACGSSGTIALELTDAPPDTDAMDSVIVTLSKVEAHVVDKGEAKDGDPADASIDKDDKWVSIPLDSRKFDLLDLQDDVTAPLGEEEVPTGKITQIRLFVDEAGTNEIRMKDGQVCALDLGEVDKTGIKINHPFKAMAVEDGQETYVVLDFDIAESVSKEGECAYKLKPVIKIKGSGLREGKSK